MKYERLKEIFENEDTKWEGDNAFQGCVILSKYFTSIIQGADHDIIYGPNLDEAAEKLTEEDAEKLRLLNWMFDEESDCLSCFV